MKQFTRKLSGEELADALRDTPTTDFEDYDCALTNLEVGRRIHLAGCRYKDNNTPFRITCTVTKTWSYAHFPPGSGYGVLVNIDDVEYEDKSHQTRHLNKFGANGMLWLSKASMIQKSDPSFSLALNTQEPDRHGDCTTPNFRIAEDVRIARGGVKRRLPARAAAPLEFREE